MEGSLWEGEKQKLRQSAGKKIIIESLASRIKLKRTKI